MKRHQEPGKLNGYREGKMKYQRLLAVLMLLIAGTPAWGKKNPSRQFMLREEV